MWRALVSKRVSLSEGDTLAYITLLRGPLKEVRLRAARSGISEGVQGRREKLLAGIIGLMDVILCIARRVEDMLRL